MNNTKELKWVWNKQRVSLDSLDERQLESIKKSIDKSDKKVWFGTDSKEWLIKVNEAIEEKRLTIHRLKEIRVNRAVHNANIITYGILGCINKRNGTKN
jgi:hypothetical protein